MAKVSSGIDLFGDRAWYVTWSNGEDFETLRCDSLQECLEAIQTSKKGVFGTGGDTDPATIMIHASKKEDPEIMALSNRVIDSIAQYWAEIGSYHSMTQELASHLDSFIKDLFATGKVSLVLGKYGEFDKDGKDEEVLNHIIAQGVCWDL